MKNIRLTNVDLPLRPLSPSSTSMSPSPSKALPLPFLLRLGLVDVGVGDAVNKMLGSGGAGRLPAINTDKAVQLGVRTSVNSLPHPRLLACLRTRLDLHPHPAH